MGKRFISARHHERTVRDTFDHIGFYAEVGDIHHKPDTLHPLFHFAETFERDLFVGFSILVHAPDRHGIAADVREVMAP